jgi:acetyl esterase/lipase
VANKAESDGVEVLLEVWPGMIHVFQSLELPEARQAMAHIADFMRARLSR